MQPKGLTLDQLQELGAKPVGGLSLEEVQAQGAVQAPVIESEEPNDVSQQSIAEGLATGVAQSVGQTVLGAGTLGRTVQTGVSNLGQALFGESNPFRLGGQGVFDPESDTAARARGVLTPETGAESVGKFFGDVAQFAIPSTYASKATVGAGLARRMLAQGLTGATVQAAKTGEIGTDELAVGAINALSVPVGDLVAKGVSSLSNHFPEWLVRPLVKQSPQARLKGRDAAKLLVDSGRIGSVDDLISQTDDVMTGLNQQIDDIISAKTSAGVSINRGDILKQVVDDINQGGGAIDEAEVLKVVNRLAPQAKGFLGKESLTLNEANQLRQALDRTLGDRAFFANQLTFNKGVLMDFTNSLREAVKTSADDVAPSVTNQITNQINSAQQALTNLTPQQIAAQGGEQALMAQAKENIVLGLRSQGDDLAADLVERVAVDGLNSVDELANAITNSVSPVRGLYSEFAKNITLKQALNARAVAGGGFNSIGMFDILTGGGVLTTTGDPVSALMAVGARRALESAPVKTTLAQVFKNTDKVASALNTASPGIRGAVLSFISSLTGERRDTQ